MNRKLFIAFSLVFYSFIQQIEAGSLHCGEKDAAACKEEFIAQMDLLFQDFHSKIMEREAMDIVKVFKAVVDELPPNDANAKMLKTSIDELKADIGKIEASRGDYEQTRAIINHFEVHIQPHVMLVNMDKKSQAKLEKVLDKHNYTKVMENFDFNEFADAFSAMWLELHAELRPTDLKAYPAYNEINEKMKAMATEKDSKKKEKLVRDAIIRVRQFCKIPFLEEVVFHPRKSTKQ